MTNFKLAALPRWLRDWVPLLLWMMLIFMLSNQPVLLEIDNVATETTLYKLAHMTVYGILLWLWWRAISPQREASWRYLVAALALTVLYGISDEIHQLFVPGRHARLADVLFDTGGGLVMILLLRQFGWLRSFPEAMSSDNTSGLPLNTKLDTDQIQRKNL